MSKATSSKTKRTENTVVSRPKKFGKTGMWYLQHTYQMRDVDRIKLSARTEQSAITEAQGILKKYPDIDQPCVIFISDDHSIVYYSQIRL